jgi:hypothetical protein
MAVWLQTRGADMSFNVVADDHTLEVRASIRNEEELDALVNALIHRSAKGTKPFFKPEKTDE